MRNPFQKRRHDPPGLILAASRGLGAYPARGLGSTSGAPSAMAGAIAQTEGYGSPGAIPTLANNPGDITGNFGYGTVTAAGGVQIAKFPTAAAGWQALQNQINLISSGSSTVYNPSMSIAQVGQLYSGGSSNWANNVASILGVSTDSNFAAAAGGSAPSSAAQPGVLATSGDTSGLDLSSLLPTDNSDLMIGAGVGIAAIVLAAWALS